MQGSATLKKVVAAWLSMCMLVTSYSMFVTADDGQVNNVSDGHLVFEGFTLQYGTGDFKDTIQALVDVYVEDIDATGLDFTLQYKSEYLVPSKYADNDTDITLPDDAFKVNTEIINEEDMLFRSAYYESEITPVTDAEHGTIKYNLSISPTAAEKDTIGTTTLSSPDGAKVKYIKGKGQKVKWGTISFRVKKPVQVSNMAPDQLKDILYVAEDPDYDPDYDDPEDQYMARISYVDDYMTVFEGPKLPISWVVSSRLLSAVPTVPSSTVSAYSLYGRSANSADKGTTADLFMYLNQEMNNVHEYYANGQQKVARITWNSTDAVITDSSGTVITDDNYDPRGGDTYTITQYYLGNTYIDPVEVKVKVTKSEITGFKYDRRVKNYYGESARPSDWGDLLMPPYITPIITGTDDLFAAPTDAPEGYVPNATPEATWNPDKWDPSGVTDDLKTKTETYTETYKHLFDYSVLGIDDPDPDPLVSTTLPWLSYPSVANTDFWTVDALRTIILKYVKPPGGGDDDNPTITAEVERESGDLVISISKDAFPDWIQSATNFNIYLPNGMVIGTASDETTPAKKNDDFVKIDAIDPTENTATVRVKAASAYNSSDPESNTMKDYRELIQSLINLGSEDFTISAIASDDGTIVESEAVSFKFDARENYYFYEGIDDKNRKYDLKDYSDLKADMFKVYEGQALSEIATYIVFPDNSTIEVAYNGKDGYQKPFVDETDANTAVLDKAKVVKWTWENVDGTGNTDSDPLPAAGTDLYLVGELSPYLYTNFGYVFNTYKPPVNDDDKVYLKIKVTTIDKVTATPTPTPSDTPTPSGSPDASGSPSPSGSPDASGSPSPSGSPDASGSPSPSGSPDASGSPSPSGSPDASGSPSPSGSPDPSGSPNPSDSPSPSPSPTATAAPQNKLEISTKLNGGNGEIGTGAEVELNKKTFEYDKKKKNYLASTIQNQVFKIKNAGSNDLTNLKVYIEDYAYTDSSGAEQPLYTIPFEIDNNKLHTLVESPPDSGKYIVDTPNVTEIESGNEAYVNIRTRHKLDAGTYTAKVKVGTTGGTDDGVLDYFTISFTVTAQDVYKVKVQNDDLTVGYGYTVKYDGGGNITAIGSTTYEVDEMVFLKVVVVDTAGYLFDKWTCKAPDSVTFDDDGDPDTTPAANSEKLDEVSFRMIEPDDKDTVTIIPLFEETGDVWVRLADLRSYNDGQTTPNQLKNPTSFVNTAFAETTYNYAVVVPGDVDKNFIEVDVKSYLLDSTNTSPNSPMTVTMKFNGAALACTADGAGTIADTTKYVSDVFDLSDPGPDTVTITTSYTDSTGATPVTYTKTYTLKIYRKAAVQVDVVPGNSPMGLIYSWFPKGTARDNAEAHFKADHTFIAYDDSGAYDQQYTPDYAATTYETKYSTEAWNTETNYDENPTALFVYNKTVFVDPGFENLKYMDNTTAVDPDDVVRTIEGVYEFTPTAASDNDNILADLEAVTSASPAITVSEKGGTDVLITELQTLNIRPGIYTLKYTFKDLDDTDSYFTRPLIVLPQKGDIDIDGDADANDADLIYQRLNKNSLYTKIINNTDDTWRQLFAYRTGDVTEDRNVNSIDANAVLKGGNVQYYEQLPTATAAPSAAPLPRATKDPAATPKPEATLPPDKAKLVLDYLGTGTALQDTAQTPGLKKDINEYDETKTYSAVTRQLTKIWVGIGIENVSNLKYFLDENGLYSVDLAIDYDPDIFEPCDDAVYTATDTATAFTLTTYASTVTDYNLTNAASVTTIDNALWRNGTLYKESLQTDLDLDADDGYKTVFVTIKSDTDYLRLKDIPDGTTETKYLLRLPFRLKHYIDATTESYTGKPLKINTSAQTFVLGSTADGVTNSGSWEGLVDKTTAVNNARNHFDSDPKIVDIFGTDGTFKVKGVLTGWNPNKPFVAEFFKTTNTTDTPDYVFNSDDVNEADEFVNGTLTYAPNGKVQWNFALEVSNLFDYTMRVRKLSHITYPEFDVSVPTSGDEVKLDNQIDLIVGDIDRDRDVTIHDRESLMHFFTRQKPWKLYKDRFEAADLNGDNAVDVEDLDLIEMNYGKAYPQPTKAPTGGGGAG